MENENIDLNSISGKELKVIMMKVCSVGYKTLFMFYFLVASLECS